VMVRTTVMGPSKTRVSFHCDAPDLLLRQKFRLIYQNISNTTKVKNRNIIPKQCNLT